MQRYPEFEFEIIRIEDAFDPSWWARVNPGKAGAQSDLMSFDMASLGKFLFK